MTNFCRNCKNMIVDKNDQMTKEWRIQFGTCRKAERSDSDYLVTANEDKRYNYCSTVRVHLQRSATECPNYEEVK